MTWHQQLSGALESRHTDDQRRSNLLWIITDSGQYVFVNLYREPLGAPMTYRAAKRLFERLARECGFPVRPHMFRHTAATGWIRAGTDHDVVQALLGHRKMEMTLIYDKPRVLHQMGEKSQVAC